MVLILIGLSNEFVIWLSRAASGYLPAQIVMKVVWLNLPVLVCILLPMAFFFGILFAFGRLYAESEMVVLQACGFGLWDQIRAMAWPALILCLVAAFFNLYLAPEAMQKMEQLVQLARADVATSALAPGRFHMSEDGHYIIFAEKISKDKHWLKNIFIAERPNDNDTKKDWAVISGERGFRHWDENLGGEYFVIQNGNRYQGNPGDLNFAVLKFAEYGIKINTRRLHESTTPQSLSTLTLWKSKNMDDWVEFNWRIAMIISVAIVALLAVPISRVGPRKNKYSALIPGMIVVIAYINALVGGNILLKEGAIPPHWGLWWVHLIGLGFAFFLMALREQWWRRFRMSK
jgi:lipopolysaccharide export system permease protein